MNQDKQAMEENQLNAGTAGEFVTFTIAGQLFGVPVLAVQDVLRPQAITRIPMGHEIAVTPLQMLMAMNTIANKGVRMKPMIVKGIKDENGLSIFDYQPQVVGQVITPRTCTLMATALRKVVGPDGTAPKAGVEGFDVAGKTGTAQKVENGQYVRKYYSSFIGYFPASDPEISILVSLDDPTGGAFYGGSVAGPVFKAVAEKVAEYLGMEPQPPQPEVAKLS